MKIKSIVILLLLAALLSAPVEVQSEGAPPGLTGGDLGTSNASFLGELGGHQAGESVAIVGDVNGDGYDDLLIGAHRWSMDQGRAYLFMGGRDGWRLNEGLGSADAVYHGTNAGDDAGISVAGAGDVNDDGYDDMLIGAPGYISDRGAAYLVLGSSAPSSGSPFDLGSDADAFYVGESASSRAGYSVAGAGDVDGDGYADILVGAYGHDSEQGRAYLVLGQTSPANGNLSNADAIYTGESTGDRAGWSVAGAGDTNGDGYADILVGAYLANQAYLVLGSSSPFDTGLGSADAIYTGENSGDWAGGSVAGGGDVNDDGYADLLIGASRYNSDQGRAYLVLGSSSPSTTGLSSADAIYTGEGSSDYAGGSVVGAGDVDGDGYSDILIGAEGYNSGQGRAYLVLGSSDPSSAGLGSTGAAYTGENSGDWAGGSVAGGGDVNGDGYADLLIGAYHYDSLRGKAYLLFSDYTSATAARYRAIQTDTHAPVEVGASGVIVDYASGAGAGSVYVTRHYYNTCGVSFATNGLLWTVDSQRGSSAQATFIFRYNDAQIAGWTESNLKLWYRERPCQDWTEDANAELDIAHNRIASDSTTDAHREYTIAPDQPDPTRLSLVAFSTSRPGSEPLWQVLLAVLLAVVLVGGRIYLWKVKKASDQPPPRA